MPRRPPSRRAAGSRRDRARGESPAPLDVDRALSGRRVEDHPDGEWVVTRIGAVGASKTYRCPGCDHEIRPGVPHVVAWPAVTLLGAAEADRRHWHTACWQARDRRGPRGGAGYARAR